jgi:hypothetical protein
VSSSRRRVPLVALVLVIVAAVALVLGITSAEQGTRTLAFVVGAMALVAGIVLSARRLAGRG